MTPFEQQFEILKAEIQNVNHRKLSSGAVLITIPVFKLPPGWSLNETEIYFIAPAGFPFAKPDCFWANPGLKLKNGGMPKNAQLQKIPEVNELQPQMWFSWHVSQWNPSYDNLSTFVHVIQARLRDCQ